MPRASNQSGYLPEFTALTPATSPSSHRWLACPGTTGDLSPSLETWGSPFNIHFLRATWVDPAWPRGPGDMLKGPTREAAESTRQKTQMANEHVTEKVQVHL